MNIANLMVRAGRSCGENPAIAIGSDVDCTSGDLARRVATMAGRFQDRLPLKPGDCIAMTNCAQDLEVLYAGWRAGLCVVPVNSRLHQREFHYILEHSGVRCCFVTPDLQETITPLCNTIPTLEHVISVSTTHYRALVEGDPAPLQDRAPSDAAWLFYTSGPTGRPKGAMLSHRNLMAMTPSYFANVDGVSPEDCIIHAVAMFHGSGLYSFPHVAKGAKQVIPASGRFDPEEIFDLITVHEGVSFFAAPTMVKRLIDHPRSRCADYANLKTIVYGGGPMYLADLKLAMNSFG